METHALPHFVESNILNSDDKKKNSISEPVHPPKNKNPLIGFFFFLEEIVQTIQKSCYRTHNDSGQFFDIVETWKRTKV